MKYELIDNTAEKRYEYRIGTLCPYVEYKRDNDGTIFLTHTFIPSQMRGQGIGKMLVGDCLAEIDRCGMKLVPLCGFVAAYIAGHPEWKRLLKEGINVGR